MTHAPRRRSRFRRSLLWFGLFVVLGVVGVFIGLSFVPGGVSHVKLSYRVPPKPVIATSAPAMPAGGSTAPAAPAAEERKELFLTYTIPTDLLQREVGALFPITEGIESMMQLVLSNPRFVSDADPHFLRLTVELRAVLAAPAQQYPGTAIVRTQLRFNPADSTVVLHNAQLAEFGFTGSAARIADSLRPVIESELATQMNGYVVFKMPKNAGWWMKNGLSLVRDVVVENGQVVVVIGT
jgi:hypothetical protein